MKLNARTFLETMFLFLAIFRIKSLKIVYAKSSNRKKNPLDQVFFSNLAHCVRYDTSAHLSTFIADMQWLD